MLNETQKNVMESIDNIADIFTIYVSIALYFAFSFLIKDTSGIVEYINILGFETEATVIRGVLINFQMMLSVYLTLKEGRTGFVTAILLNIYGIFMSVIFIVLNRTGAPLPGIISHLGVIVIIKLINQYKLKMKEQNIILLEQYDILKKQEENLEKLAYFDGLTDVLNRRMFIEALDVQIDYNKNCNKAFYVVFIDIDNFKSVNDTMGHFVGDNVLKELTDRIKNVLNEEDIIGRLGGDEIGMIIRRNINKNDLMKYMECIREKIIKQFIIENQIFRITASFGIAEYPKCGTCSADLLKKADIAMYKSKRRGKNQIIFFE